MSVVEAALPVDRVHEDEPDADGEALRVALDVLRREARTLRRGGRLYTPASEMRASFDRKRTAVLRAAEVIESWFATTA